MDFVYHRGYRGPGKELRGRGMKIGSSTGYFTEAMEINFREAKKQGYEPDVNACASDVPGVITEIEQRLKAGDRP